MAPEFILMLTKDDVTVPDALQWVAQAQHRELRIIGYKDVGLQFAQLRELTAAIRAQGCQIAMEMVTLDKESELRSAAMAVSLGVDHLLGGTFAVQVADVIRGTDIRYYPFPGRVLGHPSLLRGNVAEISDHARRLCEMDGVAGIDLLAYRFDGDVEALLRAVVGSAKGRVIAAGSIDSPERIRAVAAAGVWGFTVGGSVFSRCFAPTERGFSAQIEAILAARNQAGSGLDSRSNVPTQFR